MRKDMITFASGLVAGVVLGLMVRDKHKQMVQEGLAEQYDRMKEKFEELSKGGKDLWHEGVDKVQGAFDKSKSLIKDRING